MAISTSSRFLTSPNFAVNPLPSSSPTVRYGKSRISAAYGTCERTATASVKSDFASLYEVLGVQIGADTQDVKAAYRRLARVLHPDARNGYSSADEFMRVQSAYATLSDPGKRADYDRTLFRRQRWAASMAVRVPSPTRSTGSYGGRRWETDQCW